MCEGKTRSFFFRALKTNNYDVDNHYDQKWLSEKKANELLDMATFKWLLKFAQRKFINRRFPLCKHNISLYTWINANIKRDIWVHTATRRISILFKTVQSLLFFKRVMLKLRLLTREANCFSDVNSWQREKMASFNETKDTRFWWSPQKTFIWLSKCKRMIKQFMIHNCLANWAISLLVQYWSTKNQPSRRRVKDDREFDLN